MTEVSANYGFLEKFVNEKQVLVTNGLGRDIEHLEIVALDGFIGECREFDGIVDGADGLINIADERIIGTSQINTSDTFVVGGVVYFLSGGSSAAGELRAGYVAGAVPVGICYAESSGSYVWFRPFKQNVGGSEAVKTTVVVIDASIASGSELAVPEIPVGAKILDMVVHAHATSSAATMTLEQANGDDITVVACATDNAVARATSITEANSVVGADGVQLLGSAAEVRGIATITWR